jgi:transposase
VIVANARELKWITSSDTKNDRNDAMKLARLARADRSLLAPVEHRSAEQQAEQAVIRARDALVKSRSLLVNGAEPGQGLWTSLADIHHAHLRRTTFDPFAPKVLQLVSRSARLGSLFASRHPLVVVDGAQDTADDQWQILRYLSEKAQLVCLADLD